MQPPGLEIIPARPAVCHDETTSLDVLVRIVPPVPDIHFFRPPINLGIVLDRSGSMASGQKMSRACEAACFAISQLLPTDRVSVTIYDDSIETIARSAPVVDKPGLIARIRGVQPRGSTALHGGWAAGAGQVAEHVAWDALNRVLLLTDGLANVGVTDPKAIAADVKGMTARRVSTTTIGVGDDYNEDLLEAMADAGDGNYYYVETSVQLADIFQTELNGLMATSGRDVGLRIEIGQGVAVSEVLNELERDLTGRFKLPNLVMGMPLSIVVRLKVQPQRDRAEVARFWLDWEQPRGEESGRRTLGAALSLSAVSARQWSAMPVDPAVAEQVALLMAAQARKEVIAAIDRKDVAAASRASGRIRDVLSGAPQTAEVTSEWANLQKTEDSLILGQLSSSRKAAHYQQWHRKKGRGTAGSS
jgi:Ca-activated chloride channel family protein